MGRLSQGVALFLFTALLMGQDAAAVKSQQAKQLMGAGRFADAIAIYEELVKALPASQGLRMNLGMAQHLAGRDKDAVQTLGTETDPRAQAIFNSP